MNRSYYKKALLELIYQVSNLLTHYRMTVSTAESCTGGMIAEIITAIPGSSTWFDRGFIPYNIAAKQEMLGISATLLTQFEAVSEEVVLAMVKGALKNSISQIAIAVSGIAGPDDGGFKKAIGTVYIAWGVKGSNCFARCFHFKGDRDLIRLKSAQAALKGLLSIFNEDLLLPPVITIDGPSGSGKGTVSQALAKKLGWHYLDSGACFRILAYAALKQGISAQDEARLAVLAQQLDFSFGENKTTQEPLILLEGAVITQEIRTETCAAMASKLAVLKTVRQELLKRQRQFQKWPGLVTDGRDMGTVVFPQTVLKIFLYANVYERAKRRYEQLKKQGMHAKFDIILQDLVERDDRDQNRAVAPLKPAANALLIDNTALSVNAVFSQIMNYLHITCTPILYK